MEDDIERPTRTYRGRTVIEPPFTQRMNQAEYTRETPAQQHEAWSGFTAAKLLPDSVYLWACDEAQPGEENELSLSDACVAWVVIIMQMICYLQLIVVSSGDDSSSSSSATGGSYSLISVAAAMYLMTSIASADLGAGIALFFEARKMNLWRRVQRKMFGIMLLLSFAMLAAASIKVLFKTSSEDVDLVVGAATVLFIADVDERVMMVLKVIPPKWRLFWTFEAIGLSAALALLGVRVTGSGSNVSENGNARCMYGSIERVWWDCFIYSWYFILSLHPVSVTLVALLLNAIVASPKEFVKYVLGKGSRTDGLFALFLVLWILEPLSYYFLFAYWTNEVMLIIVIMYVIGGACWLLVCKRSVCCRGSDQSNTGYTNLRWTSRTRFKLMYSPVGLLLIWIGIIALGIKLDVAYNSGIDILDPSKDWFFVPEAIYYTLIDTWLVWCMCGEASGSPARPSSSVTANTVVTEPEMNAGSDGHGSETNSHNEVGARRLTGILLGWIQANALWASHSFLWELIFLNIEYPKSRWAFMALDTLYWFAGTLVGVCAAASSTKGVAFWSLATYMLNAIVIFIWEWINSDGVFKLLP